MEKYVEDCGGIKVPKKLPKKKEDNSKKTTTKKKVKRK